MVIIIAYIYFLPTFHLDSKKTNMQISSTYLTSLKNLKHKLVQVSVNPPHEQMYEETVHLKMLTLRGKEKNKNTNESSAQVSAAFIRSTLAVLDELSFREVVKTQKADPSSKSVTH